MQPVQVGALTVNPLFDGIAFMRQSDWAGSDWTAHQHLLDEQGLVQLPIGAFHVQIGTHHVLIDAGVGAMRNEMYEGGQLLQSLAALGVQPADIDTVVVSHLHADHTGWLEQDGTIVFPNATVHVAAADWHHFVHGLGDGRRRANKLLVVESRVQLIDDPEATILPGLSTRLTPGHTPGHNSIVLSSGSERLIVLGDALHCPAQLTETEWEFVYDVDKALARTTREALLREAEQPGTTLLPCHFPGLQAARLLPAQGTRRWVLG